LFRAMTEAALLHLTPRPRTSKKSELCTLLLMSLTTVTVASAFNFAGAYFWVGNFDHDMRYIAAFHIFEFVIIFAGMIFLTIGIIANSITFIAIFIATLSISSISRILCIAFSFGFITFDEKRCFKTFYASIHRDLRKGVGSDDRILAELLCKRDVCISLLVISAVLLIFHVASIISAFRYTKILRYEKEAKLRRLLKATAFSPSSLSVEEGYSDEEGDGHKSTESTSTSPSNTRSSSSKSYENSYTPNENISTKNAPTVDEVVQSTTGYSNHSTKSVDSISSRPSCMMKSSSDGNGIGSIDFDV
uniref:Uncharacterized protein n=1 Tax=Parascaris univalens TaxID=6257 RepID=A0A915CFV1_PARUN